MSAENNSPIGVTSYEVICRNFITEKIKNQGDIKNGKRSSKKRRRRSSGVRFGN